MPDYLVYHPRRVATPVGGYLVHHDSLHGNQDPYIWNSHFLHSYCHITEMSLQPGDLTIWVSGDTFPNFTALYCDLVFHVLEKCYWRNRGSISDSDPIVDSPAAFADRFRWAFQHRLVRRRRFTLKADPERSSPAQLPDGHLPDLLPILAAHGLSQGSLRSSEATPCEWGSRPMPLERTVARSLVTWLEGNAHVLLRGSALVSLGPRRFYPQNRALSADPHAEAQRLVHERTVSHPPTGGTPMSPWLVAILAYFFAALLTGLPILLAVLRGVKLHPGGSSFDESTEFSSEAKQRLTQHYSRMQGTLAFWKKQAEPQAASLLHTLLDDPFISSYPHPGASSQY